MTPTTNASPTTPTSVLSPFPRSQQKQVMNPILGLASAQQIQKLPPEAKKALYALLGDLSADARVRAEYCWKKSKGPMAAYWKAVSTYARHTRSLCRVRITTP